MATAAALATDKMPLDVPPAARPPLRIAASAQPGALGEEVLAVSVAVEHV
jgi:hypothetical protein